MAAISISKMRKSKQEEVKWFLQGHSFCAVGEWCGRKSTGTWISGTLNANAGDSRYAIPHYTQHNATLFPVRLWEEPKLDGQGRCWGERQQHWKTQRPLVRFRHLFIHLQRTLLFVVALGRCLLFHFFEILFSRRRDGGCILDTSL